MGNPSNRENSNLDASQQQRPVDVESPQLLAEDAINQRYNELPSGTLGQARQRPVGGGPSGVGKTMDVPVAACPDGVHFYKEYGNGAIYWSSDSGACEIVGPIYEKWKGLDGLNFPGYPTTGQRTTADGRANYNEFVDKNSWPNAVYYTLSLNTVWSVHGAIYKEWRALTRSNQEAPTPWIFVDDRGDYGNPMGLPTSDEEPWTEPQTGADGKITYFESGFVSWNGKEAITSPILI
jgi:uncharacterized protein with LGFP repeats